MEMIDFDKLALTKREKQILKKLKRFKRVSLINEDIELLVILNMIFPHYGNETNSVGDVLIDGTYSLYPNGERYFEYLNMQRKKFWRNSIFIPAAVSVMTAIIASIATTVSATIIAPWLISILL